MVTSYLRDLQLAYIYYMNKWHVSFNAFHRTIPSWWSFPFRASLFCLNSSIPLYGCTMVYLSSFLVMLTSLLAIFCFGERVMNRVNTFTRHSHTCKSYRITPRSGIADSGNAIRYWVVKWGQKMRPRNGLMTTWSGQVTSPHECSAQRPYSVWYHVFCFCTRLENPCSTVRSSSTLALKRPWRTMNTTALCLVTWTSFQWTTVTPTGVFHSHGTFL